MTYDIIVVADGSGHENGFGGYAAIAYTPDKAIEMFRMGALIGTSVDRAEFTGALEGLQMAMEIWNYSPQKFQADRHQVELKPKVMWLSDRESMILSALNLQSRSNAEDLWRRYEYYEERMTIYPVFEKDPEETMKEFSIVDLQASIGYQMMKEYSGSMNFPRRFVD